MQRDKAGQLQTFENLIYNSKWEGKMRLWWFSTQTFYSLTDAKVGFETI